MGGFSFIHGWAFPSSTLPQLRMRNSSPGSQAERERHTQENAGNRKIPRVQYGATRSVKRMTPLFRMMRRILSPGRSLSWRFRYRDQRRVGARPNLTRVTSRRGDPVKPGENLLAFLRLDPVSRACATPRSHTSSLISSRPRPLSRSEGFGAFALLSRSVSTRPGDSGPAPTPSCSSRPGRWKRSPELPYGRLPLRFQSRRP